MHRHLNILLVEDDDFDVLMFERSLRHISEHATFKRAEDGEAALEMIRAGELPEPYLSLVDVNMPRMSGLEFLEALRGEDSLQDNVVFMFTTSDNPRDIARAYRSRANGYIVKPNSRDELNDVVRCLQSFWNTCEPPPRTGEHAVKLGAGS